MNEEEEQEFTPQELSNLRGLIRDIAHLADQDLANSGSPRSMFGPWRLMMRQMLEAAISYQMAHHDAVDEPVQEEVVHFFNRLRSLERAGSQSATELTGRIGDIYQAGMFSSDPESMWEVPMKISALLTEALSAEYQAGADGRNYDQVPQGAAVSPEPAVLYRMIREELNSVSADVHDLDRGMGEDEVISLLADALDTAYKSGAGAPPSHGSRFARR